MHLDDITKYCKLMEEVKVRLASIELFFDRKVDLGNPWFNIEGVALQMRKCLELIAFGSLVSHREIFKRTYAKFETCWNAKQLLRDIGLLNPDFYPQPIVSEPSTQPGVKAHFTISKEKHLTRDNFLEVYEKCGALMHARNPDRSIPSFEYYVVNLPVWKNNIVALLDTHLVTLLGKHVFLVRMFADDGKVHHYFCETIDRKVSRSKRRG